MESPKQSRDTTPEKRAIQDSITAKSDLSAYSGDSVTRWTVSSYQGDRIAPDQAGSLEKFDALLKRAAKPKI